MDLFTNWILTNFTFFASGLGILVIGAAALLVILLWDWRVILIGLVVVQTGVMVLTTQVYQLPTEWGTVQLMVTALAAAMLALSARQVMPVLRLQRPGSWWVRLSAVILLAVSWQFVNFALPLPLLTPQITQLFLWLILCAFVLLGLSDSPLHTGVALLFWLMPVQAFLQVLLPELRLFVPIGMAEIFVGLTCSYLLLAQRTPAPQQIPIFTDVIFPEQSASRPALPGPAWSPQLTTQPRTRRSPLTGQPLLPPTAPRNGETSHRPGSTSPVRPRPEASDEQPTIAGSSS
jgi:hypothetical protein